MAGTNDAIRDVDSKVSAFAAVFAVAVVLFFDAVYVDNDDVTVALWLGLRELYRNPSSLI